MENIRLAFQGIWSHKMRSFLTMLGIIIGIASIITIVSTIKGTNEQIKENLIGSGGNVVTVQLYQNTYPYDFAYNPIPAGVKTIEESSRQELEKLGGIEKVSFYTKREFSENVHAGKNSFSGSIFGIDKAYLNLMDYNINYGRSFTDNDYKNFCKKAIIDLKAASTLFPGEYPVGKSFEIGKEVFTVVGVVEKNSSFSPTINTMEDYQMYADRGSGSVFIPSSVWPAVYKFDEPQSVAVRASDTDSMTKAGKNAADYLTEKQISKAVAAVPETPAESEEDTSEEAVEDTEMAAPMENGGSSLSYRSEDLLKQAQQLQEMSNATNHQLIWIASISLLVGGIGVMNIMLVSVTERTGEIGLKKALGAKKRRIRMQFLTEASVLTSLGGIAGVLIGVLLAEFISKTNGIPVAISIPSIVISVVFSMVIGMIFGLLPAMKAANLNPIEALRRD